MKIIKCLKCGFISPIGESLSCKRCSNKLKSVNTAQQRTLKILNILSGIILCLLVVGITTYFINDYVSTQQEKARLELEKKAYETFNEISFKADPDSINNALKLLPPQYNSPQPPDLNLVKGSVVGSISGKETITPIETSTRTKSIAKTEFRCNSGQVIGSVGGAVMSTGGCGNYTTGSYEIQEQHDDNPAVNFITTYSIVEIKPIQYDYVRGFGNKLVCFVTYEASMGAFKRTQRQEELKINPIYRKPKPIGNQIDQFTVKETAVYELEKGVWNFRKAGLKDVDRFKEISNVMIQAKTVTAN
jgi:hypothetical protein